MKRTEFLMRQKKHRKNKRKPAGVKISFDAANKSQKLEKFFPQSQKKELDLTRPYYTEEELQEDE